MSLHKTEKSFEAIVQKSLSSYLGQSACPVEPGLLELEPWVPSGAPPCVRYAPPARLRADLVLSMDVLYHLLELEVFVAYIDDLFLTSTRFVAIYGIDVSRRSHLKGNHVMLRPFTQFISIRYPCWSLVETVHLPPKLKTVGDAHPEIAFYFFELTPNCAQGKIPPLLPQETSAWLKQRAKARRCVPLVLSDPATGAELSMSVDQLRD